MPPVAQSPSCWRSPRVEPADVTPAVLRMADGSSSRGTLKTISLTGGLLSITSVVNCGSRVQLMFLTRSGPVAAAAEMLKPVSARQQPFRFVALEQGAQRRLRTIVESQLLPPDAWIEKYRAAMFGQDVGQHPLRRKIFRALLASLAVAAVCLGSVLCFLSLYR